MGMKYFRIMLFAMLFALPMALYASSSGARQAADTSADVASQQRIIIPASGNYEINVAWYDSAGASEIAVEKPFYKMLGTYTGANNWTNDIQSLGYLENGTEVVLSIRTKWWGNWYGKVNSTNPNYFAIKQDGSGFQIEADDGIKFDGGYNDAKIYLQPASYNYAPVITMVSGPSDLKVGEQGNWSVSARDPEGGRLTYSVVWGDEGDKKIYALTTSSNSQTATFTHVYNNAGAYSPIFTVADNQSLTAKAGASVRVGQVSQSGKISVQISAQPTSAKVHDSIFVSGLVEFEQSPSMRVYAETKQLKVVTSFSDYDYPVAAKAKKKDGSGGTIRFKSDDGSIKLKADSSSDDWLGKIMAAVGQKDTSESSDDEADDSETSQDREQQRVTSQNREQSEKQQRVSSSGQAATAIATEISSSNPQERVDYISLKEGDSAKVSAYFTARSAGTKLARIRVYEAKNACPPDTNPPMGMPCKLNYVLVAEASAKVSVSGEVPPKPPSGDAVIVLTKGWNMVSVPVNGKVDMNSVAGECDSRPYAWRLASTGYVKESTLEPGYGYWIKSGKDCKFSVSASTDSQIQVAELFSGWNLVGAPDAQVSISSYSGTCSIVSGPWHYSSDATAGRASPYAYSSSLMPGKAYWIKVTGSCRLGGATEEVPPVPPS